MPDLPIAITGCELTCTNGGVAVIPPTVLPATDILISQIDPLTGNTIKEGNPYIGPIAVAVSGASTPDCNNGSGTVIINPSCLNVSGDEKNFIREGDSGTGSVSGVPPSGTGSCSITVTVAISSADQTSVLSSD